ncbi:MAG: C-GCAxxG-C-C family protein [Acidobacteriota bacterium]
MKEEEVSRLSRRRFLHTIAGGVMGVSLLGVSAPSRGNRLQEKEAEKGKLADELEANFTQRGFSCAEAIFRAAVTTYGESEELVRLATPFSGGMGQGDLCGFLSGGVLAIGLLFGRTKPDENAKKGKCISLASEYYKWWKGNFPLHCSDIRKFGGKEQCTQNGRKAAGYLEELIEKELEG